MAELYKIFGSGFGDLDFSAEALISLYNQESYGGTLTAKNGFAVGKQYLNVQVTMWLEDIRSGTLAKFELYNDERFPHWWLDGILDNLWKGMKYDDILKASKVR